MSGKVTFESSISLCGNKLTTFFLGNDTVGTHRPLQDPELIVVAAVFLLENLLEALEFLSLMALFTVTARPPSRNMGSGNYLELGIIYSE